MLEPQKGFQMDVRGPRSVEQRWEVLCLIPTVEAQDLGPWTPIPGPRVSDHGLLVLVLQIHSGVILFGNTTFSYAPISS